MAILRTGFMALLLVCAANASQPLESARDQYKAHEDVPHPPQLLSEATDQTVDVHQSLGIDPLIRSEHSKKSKVYNKFQSPSAERQVELNGKPANTKNTAEKILEKQKVEDLRQRRAIDSFRGDQLGNNYYNPWATPLAAVVQVPPLSSYSLWQPQMYQISRPYYIPVWSSPGRLPFYFPPQPLFTNPGYPVDNPPRDYLPPNRGYLPPDPNVPTDAPDNSTVMPTMNKFGDGGPVWDSVPNSVAPTTSTVAPTRRTRRPGQPPVTFPPLVHNSEGGGSAGNQLSVATESPNLVSAQRPPTQQLPPLVEQSQPDDSKQPSRCVWAIISCCSTSSQEVSYSCFEQLGCTGAFWDTNPCDSEFARSAIANVMKYYNTK